MTVNPKELENYLINNDLKGILEKVESLLEEKNDEDLRVYLTLLKAEYKELIAHRVKGILTHEELERKHRALLIKCINLINLLSIDSQFVKKQKLKRTLFCMASIIILLIFLFLGISPTKTPITYEMDLKTSAIKFITDLSDKNIPSYNVLGDNRINAAEFTSSNLGYLSFLSDNSSSFERIESVGKHTISAIEVPNNCTISITREAPYITFWSSNKAINGKIEMQDDLEVMVYYNDQRSPIDTLIKDLLTFKTGSNTSSITFEPESESGSIYRAKIPIAPILSFTHDGGNESWSGILGGKIRIKDNLEDTLTLMAKSELQLGIAKVNRFDIKEYDKEGINIYLEVMGNSILIDDQLVHTLPSKVERFFNHAIAKKVFILLVSLIILGIIIYMIRLHTIKLYPFNVDKEDLLATQ